MANDYWLGVAPSVAQVHTASIDSVDATPANNTFTVTVGSASASAVGDTDVATTATALRSALNSSTSAELALITWSGTGGDIIGTADTAGLPFVATLAVSGAGTGSVTDFAETTASSSPYDWSVASNWSNGTVPGSGDNAYIDKSDAKILWLPTATVTLDELHVRRDAIIGLKSETLATAEDASTESTAAPEYRQDYLKVSCPIVRIGQRVGPGTGLGSTRVKIHNVITAASTTEVFDTATTSAETGMPAVRLFFADADADVFVRSARSGVGIGVDKPGETVTVGEVHVSDDSNTTRLFIGDGVTLTSLTQSGGINQLESAATIPTVTVNGGRLVCEADQVITALTVNAGEVVLSNRSSGNVAATTITQNGGIIDAQESSAPRTVTTWNFNEGTRRIDDHLTITNDNRSGRVTETVDLG
jgi:hypothetical protein